MKRFLPLLSMILLGGMTCFAKEYRFPLGEPDQYLYVYTVHSAPNEDGVGIDVYDTGKQGGSVISSYGNISGLQVEGKNHPVTQGSGYYKNQYYLYESDTVYIKRDDVLVHTLYWHVSKNPLELFSLTFVSGDGEKIDVTSYGFDDEYKEQYYHRADTIDISADYFENHVFSLQAVNLRAGEPVECLFLKYTIRVNQNIVHSYDEGHYEPFPDQALREGDTVKIVHACCPAECFTNAISRIESAVMIVRDPVTAVRSAGVSGKHFFVQHENRIDFTSAADRMWLYSSSGHLIHQAEKTDGFSTAGLSAGVYLMVMSVDGELVRQKIRIQ